MLRRCLALTVLVALCWPAPRIWACYAVIVGRGASADGSVLVAHHEQNGGRRILNFRRIPRRQFASGAQLRLLRGGTLAQVPETAAFLWSENPGLEFSDGYLNEWGVAIVSDGCATREDGYEALVARGEIRQGGIGYMLRRLVAERARSAREGVKVAGELVERFGYAASGRSYVIADPREAWVFAAVQGRRWAAQRVPDDCVVILPNVHIIGEVDLADTDNFLGSPDLVEYAVKRGWFDPQGGERFNFRRAYSAVRGGPPDPRRLRGRELVTGKRDTASHGEELSFGVRPAEKMTVAATVAILRDKGGPVALSTPSTQEGAVFQLRADVPREIGCIYWRTTAEPATSVLTPWYLGITETPPTYFRDVPVERQLSLEHHFQPPRGTFDEAAKLAWWTFKGLQDWVYGDYQTRVAAVRRAWSALEEREFAEQPEVEAKALGLWKTDQDAARRHLTEHCAEVAAKACGEAEKLIGAAR
ncbi:MAG TPA: C69 family dipeptidase [Thermoguttaceae bacterium]|nr:C69 family dipeptidase [Thermoguttaceae bacterium]